MVRFTKCRWSGTHGSAPLGCQQNTINLTTSEYFLFVFLFAAPDLEWKVLYVGSAHDSHQDQVLDEILVGPVPVGRNKFVLQADAPDSQTLPKDELLGVTVVLVTCRYKDREFVRVGYYVNNEYTKPGYDPDADGPVSWPFALEHVTRHILADKPRVTKFAIPWDSSEVENGNGNVGQQENFHNTNTAQHEARDMLDQVNKVAAAAAQSTPSTAATDGMETD
jgi:histone chaperone ASF1